MDLFGGRGRCAQRPGRGRLAQRRRLCRPPGRQVIVAPVPGTPSRYQPFVLDAAPLPYDPGTMAPMGCLPGDLNEDGVMDLLVYYWGRPPIAFLGEDGSATRAQRCQLPGPGGRTGRGPMVHQRRHTGRPGRRRPCRLHRRQLFSRRRSRPRRPGGRPGGDAAFDVAGR